jgi:hypothetical protein
MAMIKAPLVMVLAKAFKPAIGVREMQQRMKPPPNSTIRVSYCLISM